MALVGLVRVRGLARLLGIDRRTILAHLGPARADLVQLPVDGMPGRTGTGRNSPLYVSLDSAVRLVDHLLPGMVDRAVRRRLKAQLRRQAGDLERSSSGIRHRIGGTGSGAPPSNLAL